MAAQREQLASHAASAVLVVSMILAAGVFTGILNGSGMIKAMATVLASNIPSVLSPWLSQIVAITSMPLSLVFTPDAYYFGVLPVFAEAASAVGHDPLAIGRAAILGQMTTGFPLSPMTASTFILIGLSGVSLRDHQRYRLRMGVRDDPGHDARRVGHGSPLICGEDPDPKWCPRSGLLPGPTVAVSLRKHDAACPECARSKTYLNNSGARSRRYRLHTRQ